MGLFSVLPELINNVYPGDQVQAKYPSSNPNLPTHRTGIVTKCGILGQPNQQHHPLGQQTYIVAPKDDGESLELTAARRFVVVTDRCFQLGSWVTANGKVGQVQNVNGFADLQFYGTPHVVCSKVPIEKLLPLEAFPEGSVIIYNRWVGRVIRCIRSVTIHVGKDDDNEPYVGEIDSRDAPELFATNYRRKFKVFPSQKLRGYWHSLREANWELVSKTKKGSIEMEFEGRVANTVVKAVEVVWYVNIAEYYQPLPDARIMAEDFGKIMLIDPPDKTFRIGDIRIYKPKVNDDFYYFHDWAHDVSQPKELPDAEYFIGREFIMQCIETFSVVEVLWKDGILSRCKGVDLEPYQATYFDFIRGDYVTNLDGQMFGIVQCAKADLSKVPLKWVDEHNNETFACVPCSELKICEGFSFFPGNIVLKGVHHENLRGFISGHVVMCRVDGKVVVRCHETWELLELYPADLICVLDDPRHHTPPISEIMIQTAIFPTSKPANVDCMNEDEIVAGTPREISTETGRFSVNFISTEHHFFGKEKVDGESLERKRTFIRALGKEIQKLSKGLWEGSFVTGYDLRNDLYSILFVGTVHTPYEDSIFLFDMFLPPGYPSEQPRFFYKSFAQNSLPGIPDYTPFYVQNFCKNSNEFGLLELLTSLRDHVFVKEPYFQTANRNIKMFENTPKGIANSRKHNENLVKELASGTQKLLTKLSEFPAWEFELRNLLAIHIPRMVDRITNWTENQGHAHFPLKVISPEFKGIMKRRLTVLQNSLAKITSPQH